MLALIVSISFSGLPSQLAPLAKSALADVAKAKIALNSGNAKSGQSFLSKAESKLSSVLDELPGGSELKKLDQARSGQPGAVSQAESEAAKLDPSLAGKLGVAKQQAQGGDAQGASNAVAQAKGEAAEKGGLGEIADVYRKVTAAQSLLNSGAVSKAKGLLDQIPLR